MRAVHTIWTKPATYKVKKKWFQESTDSIYTTRSVNNNYFMKDFELLTLVVSALFYKKYSGKIDLYTDNTGYEYFKELISRDDLWIDSEDKILDLVIDYMKEREGLQRRIEDIKGD